MFKKIVAGSFWLGGFRVVVGYDDRQIHVRNRTILDLRISIDDGFSEQIQKLGGPIVAAFELE